MKKVILYLIVILNPYQDIDYDEPNAYYFDGTEDDSITTYGPEPDEHEEKSQAEPIIPYYLQRLINKQTYPYRY